MEELMAATLKPIKRTAMYRKHLALGAMTTDYYGWEAAEQFTSPDEEARRVREGVGLSDVSWLGKLDVKGKGVNLKSQISNLKSQIPNPKSLLSLEQGHWLVMCEPQDFDGVWEELERLAAAADCLHVTDVTPVYAALLIAGPKSRDVLHKLTEIDVSDAAMLDLSCSQTGLAHVHAIFIRQDMGDLLSYRLLVGREYGEYIWDALMHAGHEEGIVPFGLEAQRLLSET
jgi:sarcosine oxidase subunit alpha